MSLTEGTLDTMECKIEMDTDSLDDSIISNGIKQEIMDDLQEQGGNSDSEFEYEFLPSLPIKKERSVSPDPAEMVLDELYEAAQEGDSTKLVDLMFTQMKSKTNTPDKVCNTENDKGAAEELPTDINQNHAIMNMIKRKIVSDKEKNEENNAKKIKLSTESTEGQFSTFRNIGNRVIGNLSSDTCLLMDPTPIVPASSIPFLEKKRRKNNNRTPTPPPLTTPKGSSNKKKAFKESLQNMPTFGGNSYVVSMGNPFASLVNVNGYQPSEYTVPCNNAAPENVESEKSETDNVKERNLIDYSVLTKALNNTLESKLSENNENDIKIVIFCNNKPIQSFSVRSNKPGDSTSQNVTSTSSSVNIPNLPQGSDVTSDQASTSISAGSMRKANSVHPIKVSNIIRANAHLFPTNTVPTVNDVKEVLERNKRIASESLARFGSVYKKRTESTKSTFGNNPDPNDNLAMTIGVSNRLAFALNAAAAERMRNSTSIPLTMANIMTLPYPDKLPIPRIPSNKVPIAPKPKEKVADAPNVIEKVSNILARMANASDKVANETDETEKVSDKMKNSVKEENVVEKVENVPAKVVNVLENTENVQAKVENVPPKEENVPAKTENVLAKVENVPAKVENVPAKVENVPEKAENVPERVENVPAKMELEKVENESNVADKVAIPTVVDNEDDLNDGKLVINDTVAAEEIVNSMEDPAVKCDLCGKTFKCQRYLYRHKIRLHCNSKKKPPVRPVVPVLLSKVNRNQFENGTQPNLDNQTLIHSIPDNFSVLSKEMLNDMENSQGAETSGDSGVKVDGDGSSPHIDTENFLNNTDDSGRDKMAQLLRSGQLTGLTADEIYDCTIDKSKPLSCDSPVGDKGLIEPVYVCEQCGKFYRARKTLKDHFFREHAKSKEEEPLYLYVSGNRYQCPICFKEYQSGSELVEHTKGHTGDVQSSCCLCSKVFTSVHLLRKHMETVHTDLKPRPFQCELCDYAATNKWHLKEHYRRHTGEQPYKCPICMKPFSHQGTMNRHCKTIHKIDVPSQRPYAKNNIFDLPDLPFPNADPSTSTSQDEGTESSDQSPVEYEEVTIATSEDIDLSIVKVEPKDENGE